MSAYSASSWPKDRFLPQLPGPGSSSTGSGTVSLDPLGTTFSFKAGAWTASPVSGREKSSHSFLGLRNVPGKWATHRSGCTTSCFPLSRLCLLLAKSARAASLRSCDPEPGAAKYPFAQLAAGEEPAARLWRCQLRIEEQIPTAAPSQRPIPASNIAPSRSSERCRRPRHLVSCDSQYVLTFFLWQFPGLLRQAGQAATDCGLNS